MICIDIYIYHNIYICVYVNICWIYYICFGRNKTIQKKQTYRVLTNVSSFRRAFKSSWSRSRPLFLASCQINSTKLHLMFPKEKKQYTKRTKQHNKHKYKVLEFKFRKNKKNKKKTIVNQYLPRYHPTDLVVHMPTWSRHPDPLWQAPVNLQLMASWIRQMEEPHWKGLEDSLHGVVQEHLEEQHPSRVVLDINIYIYIYNIESKVLDIRIYTSIH